ncbi:maleylpyruvate isomerase N-terminal domain-containing protein [Streptomyces sp. NPDC014983]|uniref:maleylpyruvate isomerase N-terminal domain-containing protein n=1 Tax=Streptomyces sp. NPDC014983 TaxID=3364933 RepID=UPI0036F86D5E
MITVESSLEFPALLRLIDERSAAFRAAVTSAPDLDPRVPTCPEWTLRDLIQHLGAVHRRWASVVTADPDATPPAEASQGAKAAPRERDALPAWSAESTRRFLDAPRDAGPDRACWTWWGDSQSPQTSGAVARHQVQEAAVRTHDARTALGTPLPLPEEVALDGVDEFCPPPARRRPGRGRRLAPGHRRRTGPRPVRPSPGRRPATRRRPRPVRPAAQPGAGRDRGRAVRAPGPHGGVPRDARPRIGPPRSGPLGEPTGPS